MEGILVPLAFFACIVLIVYIYYSGRSKERMALIEKGATASVFDQIPHLSMVSYKLGFFLVGIGVGALLGNIIAESTTLKEGVAYFSMIMLFGGLSLILFHLLEKRLVKK